MHHALSQEQEPVQQSIGKSRPSSEITNYTSAASALRNKMNAQRIQQQQKLIS